LVGKGRLFPRADNVVGQYDSKKILKTLIRVGKTWTIQRGTERRNGEEVSERRVWRPPICGKIIGDLRKMINICGGFGKTKLRGFQKGRGIGKHGQREEVGKKVEEISDGGAGQPLM